jgi:cytochrome c peroxidase
MKPKALVLVLLAFIFISGTIDLDDLLNYENQPVPDYISRDNTPGLNQITDEAATLGRVLFYDVRLSANNTISCASCHKQEFAFSDTATLSVGLEGGLTGRHAMRLVNSRFSEERRFFWDERAQSLEQQSTMPIQDHVEMGFSGQDGDPDMFDLIDKLAAIPEYQRLFEFAFGDATVTEERMQSALAQFIRSIQSFDSKFDQGLEMVDNINDPFPNFTPQENLGKALYIRPVAGPQRGAGCQSCHRAPEFDIDPLSRNNGVIGVAGDPGSVDLTNTRAPSLRDLVNPQGQLNGPLMHNGAFRSLEMVIDHYNEVPFDRQGNPDLDIRLRGGAGENGQRLNLTQNEQDALVVFLRTLTGEDMYTNPMYSDPFEPDGTLELAPAIITSTHAPRELEKVNLFPNPVRDMIHFDGLAFDTYTVRLFDASGRLIDTRNASPGDPINLDRLQPGTYVLAIFSRSNELLARSRFVKQ